MSPLSVAASLHVPVEDRGVPAIHAVDLRKEFRRRERVGRRLATTSSVALAPANFRVERGECVAILGQNGSGKSTLVRLLSTLLLPDGGTARVFGHDIRTDARAVRRLVNRVSVEASFFKKLSAFENLSYAARFYGIRAADSRQRIPEILERLSFPADRRREPMEHLSRGMQQKVALARALLTAPVLLLLDEPTTGLDPRSKLEVQALVTDMRSQHDATVLLCTHDLAEAEELAGRVGILHRGELIALEAAADLKLRYGAATLEEAFFSATGDRLEDDPDPSTDEGGDSP
jgi:ABC-2 type transport system ATP-binding protein